MSLSKSSNKNGPHEKAGIGSPNDNETAEIIDVLNIISSLSRDSNKLELIEADRYK